jgi:hypothetical protein
LNITALRFFDLLTLYTLEEDGGHRILIYLRIGSSAAMRAQVSMQVAKPSDLARGLLANGQQPER